MAGLLQPIRDIFRRRQRATLLASAANWPSVPARLLKSAVVAKDSLAEGGTAFQESQVECAFYFILTNHPQGSYFGGHLRTVPLSDSEAHRLLARLPEDTEVVIRYSSKNPDHVVTFAADNPNFPAEIWPG